MSKQLMLSLFSIILIVLFIGSIIAVTASIGNARMILRAKVGDTIQKTILVKNINNETINIEVSASGDLIKDIKVLDSNFTLASGEEKDARFTIKITKNGAFENKIIVKFFSPTEQKGVVLSSNVVVMVNDENFVDTNDSVDDSNNTDVTDENFDNILNKTNPVILLLTATGIVLLIFFILLIVYYVRNGKKENIENKIGDIEENNVNNINKGDEKKIKLKKKAVKK